MKWWIVLVGVMVVGCGPREVVPNVCVRSGAMVMVERGEYGTVFFAVKEIRAVSEFDDRTEKFRVRVGLPGETVGWTVGWLIVGRDCYQLFIDVAKDAHGFLP